MRRSLVVDKADQKENRLEQSCDNNKGSGKLHSLHISWCGSMVEHIIRNDEVVGSIPTTSSTRKARKHQVCRLFSIHLRRIGHASSQPELLSSFHRLAYIFFLNFRRGYGIIFFIYRHQ